MSFTPGETLLYSGIVGMAIVAVVSIIVVTVLSVSYKRFFKSMNADFVATSTPFSRSTRFALVGCLLSFCLFCGVCIWALYVLAKMH
jgi:uncharacterized membrane protein YjgN (DUF898 family)